MRLTGRGDLVPYEIEVAALLEHTDPHSGHRRGRWRLGGDAELFEEISGTAFPFVKLGLGVLELALDAMDG